MATGLTYLQRHLIDELYESVRLARSVMLEGGGYATRPVPGGLTVGEILTRTMERSDRMMADLMAQDAGKRAA